jgi:hypothetical protein
LVFNKIIDICNINNASCNIFNHSERVGDQFNFNQSSLGVLYSVQKLTSRKLQAATSKLIDWNQILADSGRVLKPQITDLIFKTTAGSQVTGILLATIEGIVRDSNFVAVLTCKRYLLSLEQQCVGRVSPTISWNNENVVCKHKRDLVGLEIADELDVGLVRAPLFYTV